MASSFLWKRTPEPMRRIGIGLLFALVGIFLQSLTEWVFRHSPIYYTIHILLGVLAALYYLKRQERRAEKRAIQEVIEPEVCADYSNPAGAASPSHAGTAFAGIALAKK